MDPRLTDAIRELVFALVEARLTHHENESHGQEWNTEAADDGVGRALLKLDAVVQGAL